MTGPQNAPRPLQFLQGARCAFCFINRSRFLPAAGVCSFQLPDHPAGVADGKAVRGHVPGDDAAGADHTAFPDRHAGQHLRARGESGAMNTLLPMVILPLSISRPLTFIKKLSPTVTL